MYLYGIRKFIFVFLTLGFVVASVPTYGQEASRLFIRYEKGQAHNRVVESLLGLQRAAQLKKPESVAVRVCSKEPLAKALATAAADPFLIQEILNSYGYPQDKIMFLRSEDCLSRELSRPATEVWTIPEGGALPPNVEAFKSDQIKLIPLGNKLGRDGMRDYKSAVIKLIDYLKIRPSATGLVIGYKLRRPSLALRRRMQETTRMLAKSGISRQRYLALVSYWPDEVSEYPRDPEPKYPNVSVLDVSIPMLTSDRTDRQH